MHSYVVIAAKPGRQLPPDLLRQLDRPTLVDLAFAAEEHTTWRNQSDTVAYFGWQTATDVFGLASHWHTDERGVTAFSRHLWPKGSMWSGGSSWAAQLHDRYLGPRMADAPEVLGGVFTAVSIDAEGRGAIVTDPLSSTLIYRAESEDVVVFATRAALAARAVTPPGSEPARDLWGMGWLSVMGYIVGDQTGFAGTTVLPAGSWVELDPRFGSRVRSANPTPWLDALPGDMEEILDLTHADLSAEIRSVAALPANERRADITGGKDSRLILALMLQEGLTDRFTFRTMGSPALPDRRVGEALAADHGLAQVIEEPVPMEPELFSKRLVAHVFQSSGMLNAWDLAGGIGVSRTPTVAGFYGETLRTYFSQFPNEMTRAEVVERFLRGAGLPVEGRDGVRYADISLLTPEASHHYSEHLTREVIGHVDDGASDSQDRLDSFYLRQRIRRWMATMEETNGGCRVHPLYSAVGTRAAFVLGGRARRNEVVPFEVMRRARPDLAKAAFADRGWPEGAYSHLPDASEYATPPVRAEGQEAPKWQISRLEANREVIQGYILDGAPDALWEIYDRKAVRAAVTGPNPEDLRASQRLYGILTAVVWLGRYETPIQVGDPDPIPFVAPAMRRHPPPGVVVHHDLPVRRPTLWAKLGEVLTSDDPLAERAGRLLQAAARRVRARLPD